MSTAKERGDKDGVTLDFPPEFTAWWDKEMRGTWPPFCKAPAYIAWHMAKETTASHARESPDAGLTKHGHYLAPSIGVPVASPSTTPRRAIQRLQWVQERLAPDGYIDRRVLYDEITGVLDELQSAASAIECIPLDDIREQIDHIEKNGLDLKKFGGQHVDEGRCRELCAMYLREFIAGHGSQRQIDALKNRADGGKACSCGAAAGQYHSAGCGYEGVFNG